MPPVIVRDWMHPEFAIYSFLKIVVPYELSSILLLPVSVCEFFICMIN
jgi:hypothetical protein